MWLLKTDLGEDGSFLPILEEHEGGDLPRYAILSHTWGEGEVIFTDVVPDPSQALTRKAFPKVEQGAERARLDGYEYIWIDTCCIRKESSAELQEAINSMYAWYAQASVCYVYLADLEDPADTQPVNEFSDALGKCRWFTRGWCLQELLAPLDVIFFTSKWRKIGTKSSLPNLIASITLIDTEYLLDPESIQTASVAKRMSWASRRETRRVEDTAYCLMGLFNVNMPMLYGEGKKAFLRLQQEIWKEHEDQTLFLWTDPNMTDDTPHGLLADSPAVFQDAGHYRPYEHNQGKSSVEIVGKGVRITLRMTELLDCDDSVAGFECPSRPEHSNRFAAGVQLRPLGWGVNQFMRVCCNRILNLPEDAGSVLPSFIPQWEKHMRVELAHYPLDVLLLRQNKECSAGGLYFLADMLICDKSGTPLPSGVRDNMEVQHKYVPEEFTRRQDKMFPWVFEPFDPLVEDFERRSLFVVLLFRQRADDQQFAVVLTAGIHRGLAFHAFETSATKLETLPSTSLSLKSCPQFSPANMSPLTIPYKFHGWEIRLQSKTNLSEKCKCHTIDFFFEPITKVLRHISLLTAGNMIFDSGDPEIPMQFATMKFSREINCRSAVKSFAFSPDGKLLAWTDSDKFAWVYRMQGFPLYLRGVSRVLSLSFPSDEELMIICADHSLHYWSPTKSTFTKRLLLGNQYESPFSLATFSPCGTKIFTQEVRMFSPSVTTFKITGDKVTSRWLGRGLGPIRSATFSPDGSQIGLMTADGTCVLRDSMTGAVCLTLTPGPNHNGYDRCLSFSPDGKFIAIANEVDIFLWYRRTGAKRGRARMSPCVQHIAFSPSGDCMIGVPFSSKPYLAYLPEEKRATPDPTLRFRDVGNPAVSPDGKLVALCRKNSTVFETYSYVPVGETSPHSTDDHRHSVVWKMFKRKN